MEANNRKHTINIHSCLRHYQESVVQAEACTYLLHQHNIISQDTLYEKLKISNYLPASRE